MKINEEKFRIMTFIEKVRCILIPLNNVVIELKNPEASKYHLLKNEIKFGSVRGEMIYLRNKYGTYQEFQFDLDEDRDSLLLEATRSFWISSGKTPTMAYKYLVP